MSLVPLASRGERHFVCLVTVELGFFKNHFLTSTTSDGNPSFSAIACQYVNALIHDQSLQNPSLIRIEGTIQCVLDASIRQLQQDDFHILKQKPPVPSAGSACGLQPSFSRCSGVVNGHTQRQTGLGIRFYQSSFDDSEQRRASGDQRGVDGFRLLILPFGGNRCTWMYTDYNCLLSLRPFIKPMKLVMTRKVEMIHAVLLIVSPEINLYKIKEITDRINITFIHFIIFTLHILFSYSCRNASTAGCFAALFAGTKEAKTPNNPLNRTRSTT